MLKAQKHLFGNSVFAAIFVCVSMSCVILGGCKKSRTQADEAAANGILLIGNKGEPATLDPHLTIIIEEQNILRGLFEGLVSPDPKTVLPEPGVAESWEISPDGLKYTFHLRSTAVWNDGKPVTSDDFIFAWQRLLTPEMAAANAPLLHAIRGAKQFNEGVEKDFSKVGVSAPDAHTLVVELENPTPWFLSILMHPATCPLPRDFIASKGGVHDRSNCWMRSPSPVTNGAFKLVRWEPNSVIEIAKSPTYWDAATVKLNAVRFLPIESISVEETAFQGGQLHVTDTVPVNKVAYFKKQNDPRLRIDPYVGVYYYAFNTTRPPLDNQDVRLALSLAVDRATITERLLGGAQKPATSFTPANINGYMPPQKVTFDVAKAREHLAKAGFKDGAGFPKMELLYNTSENHRAIAEAIQAMWKANLGIEVELRNEDYNSYIGTRNSGSFDILRASWIADYSAVTSFLDILRGGAGNNFARWNCADYDAELNKALSDADQTTRNESYGKAENLIQDAAPVMPIYHYSVTRLIDTRVKGWYSNPMDWHPYKYVWLEK